MAQRIVQHGVRRHAPRSREGTVLLALPDADERQMHAIVAQGREWGWAFLDLMLTRGFIPDDMRPAGAIVGEKLSGDLTRTILDLGCPVVRLGWRRGAGDARIPAVLPDHAAAGRLAADHFAERGFRNVAYESSVSWQDAMPLYEGFRRRAVECGMHCDLLKLDAPVPRLPLGSRSAAEHQRRMRAIENWLAGLPRPVGILSPSATTLCIACERIGLPVPVEAAILGVGNHTLPCELSPVALSSIDMAVEDGARQAAVLLRGLMRGEPPPEGPVRIPPRAVVTRQSTDVQAVEDPVVAQALRYLWGHLEQDLSVAEVAAHVGVSSRGLQRAFKRQLDRGVVAELRRRRLQEMGRLLRVTDRPVADLAADVGFRTLVHMHKCFRDFYGTSPLQYRNNR